MTATAQQAYIRPVQLKQTLRFCGRYSLHIHMRKTAPLHHVNAKTYSMESLGSIIITATPRIYIANS